MICRQGDLRKKLRGRCKPCLRAVSGPGLGRETITLSTYSLGFLHPDVFSVVLEPRPSTTVLPPASSLKNIMTSSGNDPVDPRTVGPPAVSPASFDFQPCLPTPNPHIHWAILRCLAASLGVAQQQAGPQQGLECGCVCLCWTARNVAASSAGCQVQFTHGGLVRGLT